MLSSIKNSVKIFSGNSNVNLASNIAKNLNLKLGDIDVSKFSDGEISVSIKESVRGKDCFVVQSTCYPVNDNLIELLIMTYTLKRASEKKITTIIPYFGYTRQDRKINKYDPITAKLVADLITTAGIDEIITMDLHAKQIEGFFYILLSDIKVLYLFCNIL